MGKLTLIFDIPDKSSYSVRVESGSKTQEKNVDLTRKNVSFDVEKGDTRVYIEQVFDRDECGLLMTILKILVLPIRGILNMIFMNDNNEWEKNICAYGLKALLKVDVFGETEYEIKIKDSEFSAETQSFSYPTVETSPTALQKTEITDNKEDIDICFRNFIWRIYSVLSVNLLLFGAVFFSDLSQNKNKTMLLLLCGGIAIASFAFVLFMNAKNEKKRKYLHQLFDLNKSKHTK